MIWWQGFFSGVLSAAGFVFSITFLVVCALERRLCRRSGSEIGCADLQTSARKARKALAEDEVVGDTTGYRFQVKNPLPETKWRDVQPGENPWMRASDVYPSIPMQRVTARPSGLGTAADDQKRWHDWLRITRAE